MTDPMLRRAVWLTGDQRAQLLDCATRAYSRPGSDQDLCKSLISEVMVVNERTSPLSGIIQRIVRGLRLPTDALPVYLCHAEIEQVRDHGDLPDELMILIDPALPLPPFDETYLAPPKRRRR